MKADDIHKASIVYATLLNSKSITNSLKKMVKSTVNGEKFYIAPYCYLHENLMDVDYADKKKLYPLFYRKDKELIDINNSADIKKYIVPLYKNLVKGHRNVVGMLGIPIIDINDGSNIGDHYVSYIVTNNKLYYFDSAIGGKCKDSINENTYILIRNSFKVSRTICNRGIFEESGGVSEDENSYIGQNIFCHSWCFWFIYNMLNNKYSMNMINELAGTNKDNLIRIKKFIYNTLIHVLGMDILYRSRSFKGFNYIITPGGGIEAIL